jgi:hypothetical protein
LQITLGGIFRILQSSVARQNAYKARIAFREEAGSSPVAKKKVFEARGSPFLSPAQENGG